MFIGIAINAFFTLRFAYYTLKGLVKPNRVTWFIWTPGPLLAFFGQLAAQSGPEKWLTFSAGALPFAVFIASFLNKKAYWKIDAFDIACGVIAIIGLILWQITTHAYIAVVFGILADFIGALPTFRKAFIAPHSESATPYITGALSGLLTLLTIKTFSFENVAFSLYFLIMLSALSSLILIKQRLTKLSK